MLLFKRLVQVVLHTETDIDAVGRKQSRLLHIRILVVTAQYLRLEFHIQRIVPFREGFVTEVGVQAEHIVAHLIVAQRIVGRGVDVVLYFQLVRQLDAVFLVIVDQVFAVVQVERTISTFVPVGRDVILGELDGALEVRRPITPLGDELLGRFHIFEVDVSRDDKREIFRNSLMDGRLLEGIFGEIPGRITGNRTGDCVLYSGKRPRLSVFRAHNR